MSKDLRESRHRTCCEIVLPQGQHIQPGRSALHDADPDSLLFFFWISLTSFFRVGFRFERSRQRCDSTVYESIEEPAFRSFDHVGLDAQAHLQCTRVDHFDLTNPIVALRCAPCPRHGVPARISHLRAGWPRVRFTMAPGAQRSESAIEPPAIPLVIPTHISCAFSTIGSQLPTTVS